MTWLKIINKYYDKCSLIFKQEGSVVSVDFHDIVQLKNLIPCSLTDKHRIIYVTLHGKTDTNAFLLNGLEKRL